MAAVSFTEESFKAQFRALEVADVRIASSYRELREVNGIKQLVLCAGLDAVPIQLAVTLNEPLTELQVYLDEKRRADETPLFVLNSENSDYLAQFFAELKAQLQADVLACKKG